MDSNALLLLVLLSAIFMEDFFKSVKTTDDALELQQQLGYRSRQTIEFLSRTGPQYYASNLLEDRQLAN